MTTAATVVGHFPLVLVSGPGSQARNSIGIMLVAGMLIGTLFTLFVVPAFYALIAAEHQPATAAERATEWVNREAGVPTLDPAHA
jgi:multidrug efflux pump